MIMTIHRWSDCNNGDGDDDNDDKDDDTDDKDDHSRSTA